MDMYTNLFLQNAGDFSQGSVQAGHFVAGPLATVLPLLLLYQVLYQTLEPGRKQTHVRTH